MDDDNLHTPEGWHIVRLEAEIVRLRAVLLRTIPMVRSDLRDPGLLQKIFSSLAEPPEERSDG